MRSGRGEGSPRGFSSVLNLVIEFELVQHISSEIMAIMMSRSRNSNYKCAMVSQYTEFIIIVMSAYMDNKWDIAMCKLIPCWFCE
jgi:hypothetical protein